MLFPGGLIYGVPTAGTERMLPWHRIPRLWLTPPCKPPADTCQEGEEVPALQAAGQCKYTEPLWIAQVGRSRGLATAANSVSPQMQRRPPLTESAAVN